MKNLKKFFGFSFSERQTDIIFLSLLLFFSYFILGFIFFLFFRRLTLLGEPINTFLLYYVTSGSSLHHGTYLLLMSVVMGTPMLIVLIGFILLFRKKLLKLPLVILIIVCYSLFYAYDYYPGSETIYYPDPVIDTQGHSEFSWEKFEGLKAGMTMEEVRKTLGDYYWNSGGPSTECYVYTTDGNAPPGSDYAWKGAYVCYQEGKVSETFTRFHYD